MEGKLLKYANVSFFNFIVTKTFLTVSLSGIASCVFCGVRPPIFMPYTTGGARQQSRTWWGRQPAIGRCVDASEPIRSGDAVAGATRKGVTADWLPGLRQRINQILVLERSCDWRRSCLERNCVSGILSSPRRPRTQAVSFY